MLRSAFLLVFAGICVAWVYAGTQFEWAAASQERESTIIVSEETTFLTEPVDEQGYLQVIAALNRELSEGVTRENNAAVLWLEAIGFRAEGSVLEYQARELGCEVPGLDQPFFRNGSSRPGPFDLFVPEEQFDKVIGGPWKGEEHPEALAWIEANEQALAKVAEAVKRPRYYVPREGDAMWGILIPDVQWCRAVSRCLLARVHLRMEQGERDLAWQDLMTIQRLARMVSKGPFLVERLVGAAIESVGLEATSRWLETMTVMDNDIEGRLAEFNALGPMPRHAGSLQYERLMMVDLAIHMERGQGIEEVLPDSDGIVAKFVGRGVDWNLVLTQTGEKYQEMDRILQIADSEERRREIEEFSSLMQQEQRKLQERYSGVAGVAASLFTSKEQISLDAANLLLGLITPAIQMVVNAEDRIDTERELVRLAFELKRYELEHAEFPETLEGLSPQALRVPEGERGLVLETVYRRTDTELLFYHLGRDATDNAGPPLADRVDDFLEPITSDDRGIRWSLE